MVRSWSDQSRNLTELIFQGVTAALTDASTDIGEVDGVVLGAHDLVDGRGLTSMVTAPGAGAYLRDEVRLGEDGATALALAAARVRGGHNTCCIVASWGRASEGSPDDISRQLFDPFLVRPFGLTELSVSAMRAGKALRLHPEYARWRDAAGERRSAAAGPADRHPSIQLPLRAADLPTWADVVSAVIISETPGPVELVGIGLSSEDFNIGDRDLLGMPALRSASARALEMSGVSQTDITAFEIDGLTSFDEALGLEAVGAAGVGAGMELLATAATVNSDGGSAAGYCAPAMGLVRVAQAFSAITQGGHAYAMASGSSVVAAQNQVALVLHGTERN